MSDGPRGGIISHAPPASKGGSGIPPRALILALAALLVPAVAAAVAPEWLTDDRALLLWMTPLLPAFLLAYYHGWRGAEVALAGGMAALAVANVAVVVWDARPPGWRLMLGLVVTYLLLTQGIAFLAELLHRERSRAESTALTDPLTGLANRRHVTDHLDRAFASAVRGQELAVVLFDIDHFKSLNDRFGHAAGDVVLEAFAELLDTETRRMDLSARFGGEEFLTVLASASEEQAVAFAERVRRMVGEIDFPSGRITVSAGVAVYQDGTGSPDLLVAEADRALYRAKAGGRNRVEVARWSPGEGAAGMSEGAIEIESRRRGAEPESRRTDAATGVASDKAAASATQRAPLVVVVDDDPEVERSVARMLVRLGYDVFDARGPHHVLSLFDTFEPGRIDLLITDVIMPGMNGLSLVDELDRRGHQVRVIYMSGYVHGEVKLPSIPGVVSGFLGKPIELEALEREVRRVLSAPLTEAAASWAGGATSGALGADSAGTAGSGSAAWKARRKTILIVDDDEGLRASTRRILEQNGHDVLDAPSAHAALALVEVYGGAIDVIVCDLVLPGLDGREAANLLLARCPGARVLYTSGFSMHEAFVEDLRRAGESFLPKPFGVLELLEAVRRVEGGP